MAQLMRREEVKQPQLTAGTTSEPKKVGFQTCLGETIDSVSTRDSLEHVECIPTDEESAQSEASLQDSSCEEIAQAELRVVDSIADVITLASEATDTPRDLLPVTQVGPWRFHGNMTILYGGGGALTNSVVRKAIVSSSAQPSQRTTVAVKTVPLYSDEESIAMIRTECKILHDLADAHPHITPMVSCAELMSECVLLTAFASDGDLSQQVRIGCECLEEHGAQRLASQLMSALAHLHKQKIIHGDVMPKNIFLSKHRGAFIAQLGDFGLAARLPEGENLIHLENMQGSHGYLPPEMLRRKELGPAGDLFALGVMTFQLLGAHDPFYPPSQVCDEPEFDEACWEPISSEARQFVVELLAVEAKARGTSDGPPRQWLANGDMVNPCTTRGPLSPKPAQNVHFHSLAAACSLWEAAKPQFRAYAS